MKNVVIDQHGMSMKLLYVHGSSPCLSRSFPNSLFRQKQLLVRYRTENRAQPGSPNAEPKRAIANKGTKEHTDYSIPGSTNRLPPSLSNHHHGATPWFKAVRPWHRIRQAWVGRDTLGRLSFPTNRAAICTLVQPQAASSNRQLGIPPPEARPINCHSDIRSHDRYVPRKGGDGAEEVAEEDGDTVELDDEADKGPPKEDEGQAAEEGGGPARLLLACEEEEGLLGADYYCQADQEEYLGSRSASSRA